MWNEIKKNTFYSMLSENLHTEYLKKLQNFVAVSRIFLSVLFRLYSLNMCLKYVGCLARKLLVITRYKGVYIAPLDNRYDSNKRTPNKPTWVF